MNHTMADLNQDLPFSIDHSPYETGLTIKLKKAH